MIQIRLLKRVRPINNLGKYWPLHLNSGEFQRIVVQLRADLQPHVYDVLRIDTNGGNVRAFYLPVPRGRRGIYENSLEVHREEIASKIIGFEGINCILVKCLSHF